MRYILAIVENHPDKDAQSNTENLKNILDKATCDSRYNPKLQSASTLLFDLKSELVPFCKLVVAAEELGHQTQVLSLEQPDASYSSTINCSSTLHLDAANKAAEVFND